MPRTGKRIKVSTGIYRNGPQGSTYEVRATVNGRTQTVTMPGDSTLKELKAKRADLFSDGHGAAPRAERGTLAADVPKYLRLIAHLATVDDREDHLAAWCEVAGHLPRHRITDQDVLAARVRWLTEGRPDRPPQAKRRRVHSGPLSAKTINHYTDTLRNLYHVLDGRSAKTPCDTISHLPVARTPIQRIPETLMLAVDQQLQAFEQSGRLRDAKVRARFRVLVSTGKRPIEVMRAKAEDVNLDARVWVPRDAKGGHTAGVYLNDDQLAAWRLFVEAGAWGAFSHGSFVKTLRGAGWPAGLRLYQARHTTWITASERGVDLHDIAAGAGHTDPRMTRRMYVPVLNSRLQKMSEALEGRFAGWPESVGPERNPGRKSNEDQ